MVDNQQTYKDNNLFKKGNFSLLLAIIYLFFMIYQNFNPSFFFFNEVVDTIFYSSLIPIVFFILWYVKKSSEGKPVLGENPKDKKWLFVTASIFLWALTFFAATGATNLYTRYFGTGYAGFIIINKEDVEINEDECDFQLEEIKYKKNHFLNYVCLTSKVYNKMDDENLFMAKGKESEFGRTINNLYYMPLPTTTIPDEQIKEFWEHRGTTIPVDQIINKTANKEN